MLAVLSLALFAQQVTVRVGAVDDSTRRRAERDSLRYELVMRAEERRRERQQRPVRRAPVTPELARTAFADSAARTLLLLARAARLQQDSALLAYDATARQRVSLGMNLRAIGRDRLLFRSENVSRVRWSRRAGTHIDLLGQRQALPQDAQVEADELEDMSGASPVPYYPGREALWIGPAQARAEVDERELVHPLALGSEAYYTYATGDSLVLTLPDGRAVRLRELRVAPRRSEWKLTVGSFWFDAATGQLVRASYRLGTTLDIWRLADEAIAQERADRAARGERPAPDDDAPPAWVKAMMSPMRADVEAITVDYGLFGGRFWLPRAHYLEASVQAAFMRIPIRIEEAFRYAEVNGVDSLPPVPPRLTLRALRDSLFGGDTTRWSQLDSTQRRVRIARLAAADSARQAQAVAQRAAECAAGGWYTRADRRGDGALEVTLRVPCDTAVLARSPEFTGSIYDPGEDVFGAEDRAALVGALDFSLQPVWAPMPVDLSYGLQHVRYNRVEGLSLGVGASQRLGRGVAWDAFARVGTGDWWPNLELGVSRSNGRARWRAGGYRRLAVANDDRGAPLGFGASLGALLYGRDEGYYFRTTGVEVTHGRERGGGFGARAFVQRERAAGDEVTFNVSRALGGGSAFLPNIEARAATVAGVALRDQRSAGLDPAGWRALTDLRLEGGWARVAALPGARGPGGYARASGEVTVSHALPARTAAALTVGAGVSGGTVTPQRAFYLGGAQTVRGQLLGTGAGDAFWLARGELALREGATRPVLFADLGWAGSREAWRSPGRPLSGVGIGTSVLDGLLRIDTSRGIYPRARWRVDVYTEGRF